MLSKSFKYLFTASFTLGLLIATTAAQAYWVENTRGPYWHHRYNVVCRYIPGHWNHGHWVPAHRNCWRQYY